VQYADRPVRTTSDSSLSTRKDGSARRTRLFDDLTTLFLAEGFLHLTTGEIARRLRCSKTTLYQIAPTREEIYAAVVDRYLDGIRADGRVASRAADDFPSALVSLLRAGVTGARGASWEFVRDMRRHPASRRRLDQHQRRRVADVERLVEAGMRKGAFQGFHPRLVAEVILTLIAKIFEPELLASVGLSLAEAYDEAYRMVEYGLLPRTREARGSSNGSRRAPRKRR
jgi:AcrR family transcriptional regulator